MRGAASVILSFALTAGLTPTHGSSQVTSPAQGVWEGSLDVGGVSLRLVFHVDAGAGGGLSGTLDSPDQGANGIPASSVSLEGRTFRFAVASLGATFEGTLSDDGASVTGTFTQGPARLPLTVRRVAAPTEPERPQNPVPPYRYRTEEVTVETAAAGVTLAGTLTLPPGAGPFPAAVLVSGSGPQDRDEAIMGHKPFLVLADHLTRAGIAVLRYDDRGVGRSTGTFAEATSVDFTSDALAAVAYLRSRAETGAVGIVGHSEGGLVGPMAAVRSSDVAFVVMLAGPGLPGDSILYLQGELIARASGIDEETLAQNRWIQTRLFDIVRAEPDPEAAAVRLRAALKKAVDGLSAEARARWGQTVSPEALEAQITQVNSPWFRYFLTHDPRPTLEQVRVPVLALNGEKDLQVPAEANLREVRAALERGGNPDVTTRMLPGLNHLFQAAATGAPAEYARTPETMNPAALDAVSSWILERFATRR